MHWGRHRRTVSVGTTQESPCEEEVWKREGKENREGCHHGRRGQWSFVYSPVTLEAWAESNRSNCDEISLFMEANRKPAHLEKHPCWLNAVSNYSMPQAKQPAGVAKQFHWHSQLCATPQLCRSQISCSLLRILIAFKKSWSNLLNLMISFLVR